MRVYVNNKEKVIEDPIWNTFSELVDGVIKIYDNRIDENVKPKKNVKKQKPKVTFKPETLKITPTLKNDTPSVSTFKTYNKKNERKFIPLYLPKITEVLFNDPATIVWFEDGSKSVAIAGHGDKYDKETGLATCLIKRVLGNKEYRRIMDKYCYPHIDKEKLN